MHIIRPNMFVDMACMCLAWIIAHVLSSWLVVHFYVSLRCLIEKPEILHFHSTGPLSFDRIIYDTHTGSVVNVYRCLRLWMPHL